MATTGGEQNDSQPRPPVRGSEGVRRGSLARGHHRSPDLTPCKQQNRYFDFPFPRQQAGDDDSLLLGSNAHQMQQRG